MSRFPKSKRCGAYTFVLGECNYASETDGMLRVAAYVCPEIPGVAAATTVALADLFQSKADGWSATHCESGKSVTHRGQIGKVLRALVEMTDTFGLVWTGSTRDIVRHVGAMDDATRAAFDGFVKLAKDDASLTEIALPVGQVPVGVAVRALRACKSGTVLRIGADHIRTIVKPEDAPDADFARYLAMLPDDAFVWVALEDAEVSAKPTDPKRLRMFAAHNGGKGSARMNLGLVYPVES